jgi:hypothetical protein
MTALRGSPMVYTGWPKPMTISLRPTRSRISASASSAVVALLDLAGGLVGPAVLGPAQGADGTGDSRVEVRVGAGHHPGGEGGGVEFVLGVEDERGVHGPHPELRRWGRPCSRCRKCPPMESSSVSTSMRCRCGRSGANRAAWSLGRPSGGRRWPGPSRGMDSFSGSRAPRWRPRAQHVHGMGRGGELLQHRLQGRGQAAQASSLRL